MDFFVQNRTVTVLTDQIFPIEKSIDRVLIFYKYIIEVVRCLNNILTFDWTCTKVDDNTVYFIKNSDIKMIGAYTRKSDKL